MEYNDYRHTHQLLHDTLVYIGISKNIDHPSSAYLLIIF